MASRAQLIEAPDEEARSWMQYSLEQGFDFSAAVLAAGFFDQGQFLAIVSDDFDRAPFNYSQGGVLGQDASRECLAQMLGEWVAAGAKSVLIEDDLSGRSDPVIIRGRAKPVAFLGDRVLHWCDLTAGARAAVEAINRGASGYPTNAFLLDRSAGELGLADRREVGRDLARAVVQSLQAIVVSAFDNESFLIWLPDSLAQRLSV